MKSLTIQMRQRMIPQEIYNDLERKYFPNFHKADLILVNHHGNFFSTFIKIADVVSGGIPHCTHIEFNIDKTSGLCLGADRKGVTIKPLQKFFDGSYDVYVYTNINLTEDQRTGLRKYAYGEYGKYYDCVGIFWKFLDTICCTDWFSRKFNSVKWPYCSELLERTYDNQGERISYKPVGTSTPSNIFEYVENEFAKGWRCVFSMVLVGEEWRTKLA